MRNTHSLNTLINYTWNTLCLMKHNQWWEPDAPTMLGHVFFVCPGVWQYEHFLDRPCCSLMSISVLMRLDLDLPFDVLFMSGLWHNIWPV